MNNYKEALARLNAAKAADLQAANTDNLYSRNMSAYTKAIEDAQAAVDASTIDITPMSDKDVLQLLLVYLEYASDVKDLVETGHVYPGDKYKRQPGLLIWIANTFGDLKGHNTSTLLSSIDNVIKVIPKAATYFDMSSQIGGETHATVNMNGIDHRCKSKSPSLALAGAVLIAIVDAPVAPRIPPKLPS